MRADASLGALRQNQLAPWFGEQLTVLENANGERVGVWFLLVGVFGEGR